MRLSDRKIEALAEKLVRWMDGRSDLEFLGTREAIVEAVIVVFQEEKAVERQLEEEVDVILQRNESRIRHEGVDSWVMRRKIRQQLAREKGVVL